MLNSLFIVVPPSLSFSPSLSLSPSPSLPPSLPLPYLQMWLTFAPVPSYTANYYNVSEDDVDWFSMAYFVVSLVTGFVSIYVLDTLGLKVAVRIYSLLSVVYVYVFMRDCTMYAYLDMAGRTCVHVRLSVVWVYFSFFFGILPCDA